MHRSHWDGCALCVVAVAHLRLGLDEDLLDVLGRLAHVLVDELGAVDDHERPADVEADRLGRHRLAGARLAVEEPRDALRGRGKASEGERRRGRAREGERRRVIKRCRIDGEKAGEGERRGSLRQAHLRAAVLLLEAPLAEEHRLRLRVVDHLLELLLDVLRQHHLLEPVLGHDAAVEVGHGEAAAQLVRGARVQVGHRHGRFEAVARDGNRERREPRVLDEAALQLVLAREQHVVHVGAELQLGRRHTACGGA